MILVGILIAIPLIALIAFPEEIKYIYAFAIPAFGSIVLGLIICLICQKDPKRIDDMQQSIHSDRILVLFVWFWGILVGSIPFILGKQLTVVQSLFESVSGWTTTGLSTMDVTVVPQIYLFYRSFMQFCGGLGFVMMMIIIVSNKQSMNLYDAEGHPDKLMPNLKKTARVIFIMYGGFLLVGVIAYTIAGMDVFDALCHSMCSLSTGGFSNKLNSIGEYNSFPIEIISIVLMLIGTTNFAVLLLLIKRKWRQVSKISEIRFMFVLLLIFIPLMTLSLFFSLNYSAGESIRHSVFNVVSALSTTGYSTMSYVSWPPFAIGIMIILMLIGGGMGSTAGGIKMSRVYLAIRTAFINIRKRLFTSHNVKVSYYVKAQGKASIDEATITDTMGFIICYFIIFIVGSLLITLTANCGLTEGMFEFASSLGTVGLSIGITGPDTSAGTLIVEMCGMILGRLEIFAIILGVSSAISVIRTKVSNKVRSL